MPTYEYQCKNCEHRFEIWQKMADDALTICPECKGAIRRIFFPAGIVFKGSGFYKTDHGNGTVASDNPANNGNNGNADAKENTPKTEGATESKANNEKAGSENKASSEKASSVPATESKATAAAD